MWVSVTEFETAAFNTYLDDPRYGNFFLAQSNNQGDYPAVEALGVVVAEM